MSSSQYYRCYDGPNSSQSKEPEVGWILPDVGGKPLHVLFFEKKRFILLEKILQ